MNEEKYMKYNPNYIRGVAKVSGKFLRLLVEAFLILAVGYAGYIVGQQPREATNLKDGVEAVLTTESHDIPMPTSEPIRLRDAR